ncbi:uncharacterized protein LOC124158888 [Ischnura elegans]|uniref:uncharacterized protein LOC124158888 n=1 Tax=Ischnura elegans TaxID=197161 RepID=UPI001ED88097|nr:uncharacterized protein LOC124158888 [Ischnura elegans]
MNSARNADDNGADSDATYCSEAENENGEGNLNDAQETTSIPRSCLDNENQFQEVGMVNAEIFEDKGTQENIIPDSAPVFHSRAPLFTKNVSHIKNIAAITQAYKTGDTQRLTFTINEIAHENIIHHSSDTQNVNAQSCNLSNSTTPPRTAVPSLNTHPDDSEGIISFFKSSLSFTKGSDEMGRDESNLAHQSLETSNDIQEKNYQQRNHNISHSEPLQSLHERAHHLGEKKFHSEPSEFNPLAAKNVKHHHDIPKKRLLEHHRQKMMTHFQTLTSRLNVIRNEVSQHFRGYGPKLKKTKAMSLFEEVKILRQIMAQLYDASTRIVSHIGGKSQIKSTEYSAADQTCERLLVQLNPENFREDFTPPPYFYDSEHESDEANTKEMFCTQDYEDENPEIIQEYEYNTPPRRFQASKNVRFLSPLAKLSTHSYSETPIDINRKGIIKNDRPPVPKAAYHPKNDGELETEVLFETSEMPGHDTKIFRSILKEGSRISSNDTGIDSNGCGGELHSQRPDEAGSRISDTSNRKIQQNKEVASCENSQKYIVDGDVAMPNRNIIATTTLKEHSGSNRQAPSPEIIFTGTASSEISWLIQSQKDYVKNCQSGSRSPKTLINPQEKIQSPNHHSGNKDQNTTDQKSIQNYLPNENNDSDITYISQQPINSQAGFSMSNQDIFDGGTRDKFEAPEKMLSDGKNQTYNLSLINYGTTPQNRDWDSQRIQHDAPMMHELATFNCSQETELFPEQQIGNAYTNQQYLSLTCLEATNSQNTTNTENIINNRGQQGVSNECQGQQINTQSQEDCDDDIPDITFDCFTSDDETQLPSSQLSSNRANISINECTYINDDNDSQSNSQRLISKPRDNDHMKESSKWKGVSPGNRPSNFSEENKEVEVIISDFLNKSQPPGWCNIFEQHKAKKTLPTLTELMIAGMISPGEMVLSLKGSRAKATLLKNAKIMTSEGATFQTPMAWCSAWHEGKTVSRTLAYQRVYYNGVTLMDICQKAFNIAVEEMASAFQGKRRRTSPTDDPVENNEDIRDELNYCPRIAPISNCSETVLDTKIESTDDLIMAIQSVYVHNEDEYVDADFLEDFLNTGIPPNIEFQAIDQW